MNAVASMQKDRFLGTTVDTLVEHLAAQYSVSPLQMDEQAIHMDQAEAKIDVTGRFEYGGSLDGRTIHANGHTLTFYIPFTGDADLWRLRPNLWSSWMPSAEIDSRTSCLVIRLTNTSNTEPAWYKQELNRQLESIRQLIASQTSMISQFNTQLPNEIRNAIQRRRTEIEKLQGLAAAFDFPLVKRPGMPEFKPVEMTRRVLKPLPRPPSAAFKPEPAISDGLYDELLGIIRHAGASFEGTPQTYLSLGEEGHLRWNLITCVCNCATHNGRTNKIGGTNGSSACWICFSRCGPDRRCASGAHGSCCRSTRIRNLDRGAKSPRS